jgi:serine/threonine protein kinase
LIVLARNVSKITVITSKEYFKMIGELVSHYRIVGTLGRGGMSVVYKAQDTRLGRFVALKFLLEEFCTNRESLEQFQQEARTASALNHPGICTIHDIDEHRDRPFIVMEYLDGETLREKLRKGGFTTGEAVACGIHIADALSKAHASGIVHRDISPTNLFMTEGRIKLLDFGIAKLMSVDRRRESRAMDWKTSRLTLTGTIHYMSPEQAQDNDVDARSDIFSVGVVLYEMLSGRQPFTGSNIAAIIHQIINSTPEFRRMSLTVPTAVQNIVSTCLEKHPERRYQTAEELRKDLTSAAIAPLPDWENHVMPAIALQLDNGEEGGVSSVGTLADSTHKSSKVLESPRGSSSYGTSRFSEVREHFEWSRTR